MPSWGCLPWLSVDDTRHKYRCDFIERFLVCDVILDENVVLEELLYSRLEHGLQNRQCDRSEEALFYALVKEHLYAVPVVLAAALPVSVHRRIFFLEHVELREIVLCVALRDRADYASQLLDHSDGIIVHDLLSLSKSVFEEAVDRVGHDLFFVFENCVYGLLAHAQCTGKIVHGEFDAFLIELSRSLIEYADAQIVICRHFVTSVLSLFRSPLLSPMTGCGNSEKSRRFPVSILSLRHIYRKRIGLIHLCISVYFCRAPCHGAAVCSTIKKSKDSYCTERDLEPSAMKTASSLLGMILDLGKEMLIAGAEVWRVEDILQDVCEAYCFKHADLWIISSCLHATVTTWDGRLYTQIRTVEGRKYDLDKLDSLYGLAKDICEKPVGINTVKERLDEITDRPGISPRMSLMAMIMAAMGFTVFFSGGISDALTAAVIAAAVYYLGDRLRRNVNNLLAYNTIASFTVEAIALIAFMGAVAGNTAAITTAGIFLLISGLGITNGIGDFLHGNTLSGLSETSNALLGAGGIAIGISLAMLAYESFRPGQIDIETVGLVSNPALQIITCTIGCVGFALMFGARKKALIYSAIGSALTEAVYIIVADVLGAGFFSATLAGAVFVAFYANMVNMFTNIPSAIFQITCIFPLLPGSNLYFTVLGAVTKEHELFTSQGRKMILIAVGIALGYIIVDVMIKFVRILMNKVFGIVR